MEKTNLIAVAAVVLLGGFVVGRIDGKGKQISIRVKLNDLIKDGDISQNVAMMPGDTLIIPQSWF